MLRVLTVRAENINIVKATRLFIPHYSNACSLEGQAGQTEVRVWNMQKENPF